MRVLVCFALVVSLCLFLNSLALFPLRLALFSTQVAGPQNHHMRRWHLPPGSLNAMGSGGRQHELLKQIRLLIVAYDNMDQQTRAHLASTAEVRLVVRVHVFQYNFMYKFKPF